MSRKRIVKITLILIVLVGGIVASIFIYQKNRYRDLVAYEENLLNIAMKECVESAVGEVIARVGQEEYARARLEIKEGCEEEILKILTEVCGSMEDISNYTMPAFSNHELAIEMKNREILGIFFFLRKGEVVMTRSWRIYVTVDENQKMYLYFFG